MKILQTQTLRGPNCWSVRCSKLVVVLVDLELADGPSDVLPGFFAKLLKILPGLKETFCAPKYPGAFLNGELRSAMIGHVFQHVALELQSLADMSVAFGSICETAVPGTYQVAVEYQHEEAGCYATRAALRLCQSILDKGFYPESELRIDVEDLRELRAEAAQGASTEALIQEAESRGIPWAHLETCDLFQFGYGKYQKRVQAALTSQSNILGVELACDKERTKEILTSMGAPVPQGKVIYAFRDLEDAIEELGGYPIVIKPLDGNQGRGITIDIRSWRQAEFAYDRAKEISDGIIVEHFYQGRDHRILVVNHKVVAVAERVPAHVVGNGQDTIETLVEQKNQDPRRGDGHDTPLTKIKLDRATDEMLSRQGFTLDTVLQPEQICYLRANANLSTGGTAIDRTDEIHPDTLWLAERASRVIDLDIVGIDVITTDITQPLKDVDGVIVEVNAAPGLRMHMAPSEGMARNVAAPILDMLYPAEAPTRIPVVAVAESVTHAPTPLIAHILSQTYDAVGCTTTDGVYISNYPVKTGDATNAQGAELILQDPTVDMAVLETSRSSILRSGLAFEHCDIGVLLDVAADPTSNFCTLDHRARALSVIAGAVDADGYAVLNADDARVVAMAERVQGKVAYFSTDPENAVVRSHLQQGGIAAVYDEGYLAIVQQDKVERIEKVANLPLSIRGTATATMAHSLAACLTAYIQGVSIDHIRAALLTYRSSDPQLPESTDGHGSDDTDYSNQLKQYLDSMTTVSQMEHLPQLEPLPIIGVPSLSSDSRAEPLRLRTNPIATKPLFQFEDLAFLNGFQFWGKLTPSGFNLANMESSAISASDVRPDPIAPEVTKSTEVETTLPVESLASNDPTKLWAEFENRLKPQNVLQDYALQNSAIATVPDPPSAATPPGVKPEESSAAVSQIDTQLGFTDRISSQIKAIPSKVATVEKMARQLQGKLTTVAQAMKEHGLQEGSAEQRIQIRQWAKAKAPVVISVTQKVAEQVLDKGGTVVAIAVVLTRIAGQATFELGKEVGAIVFRELREHKTL